MAQGMEVMTNTRVVAAVVAGLVLAAGTAVGQWTVTVLHPEGAWRSSGFGVWGDVEVGSGPKAMLWRGTAASSQDLNPIDGWASIAFGAWGDQQAGYADIHDMMHAGMWTGTAGSWIDLHPAGVDESLAWAAWGDQQVGDAILVVPGWDRVGHASLWRGSAGSWVDLNPAGVSTSEALGAG